MGTRTHPIAAFLAALLVCSLLAPSPAVAFELFGYCFSGDCEAQDENGIAVIDPHTYDISADIQSDGDEELDDAIKAASDLWRGKDDPVAGSAGLITRAQGDYRRILAALYNNGYYAGVISITINGREAANLVPGTQLPKASTVEISVRPGPPYAFGQARIENQAPVDVDYDDVVPLPADEGFAPGERAKAGKVRLAGRLATRAWRQQGYPKAKVAAREATAIHPDRQLNVTLRMDPGRRADFGETYVEGAEDVDADFIAYMTGIEPGTEFDPDELKRARDRLDRLGVFALHKIEEADIITADGLLPLNVVVQERKRRRIGIGATYSSIDGAGMEAFWLHRNLFGRAERLKLTAQFGGIGASGSLDADEFDYYVGADFTKPGAINPDTDFVANIFGKREFNETFRETSAGGLIGLKFYYSETITAEAGAFAKYGDFRDAFGDRRFLTTGFSGALTYDGRDNKLEPTKGIYTEFKARPFYEWEYANAAARLEVEARTYYSPDGDGRTVFAARAKAGSLIGPSIAETPPDLLFATGGGGSVRGYGFRNIGLRNAAGQVTGGKSLLQGSIELRQRIGESFGVVAFADAGTVGTGSFSGIGDDFKIGVGAGLRYYTGLGAIRLDVAIPLDPEADDPSFAIYAGIGQAF